jgi:hypothetical protein
MVFEAMLEKAASICGASFGNIYRWDGELLLVLASYNTPPAFAEMRRSAPVRPGPGTPLARMVTSATPVHIDDLAAEAAYLERQDLGKRVTAFG